MLQNPATKSPLTVVTGYSRLFRRGATYYFRVGVPNELRKAIGKTEVIKSLRTTDFQEAKRLVAFESADTDARFISERRKLKNIEPPRTQVPALSDAEIHRLVIEWFIDIERESEEWWETSGQSLDDEALPEVLENLQVDAAVFNGGNKHYEGRDGKSDLDDFLAERGMDCPSDSPAYRKLCEAFRRGRLENILRLIDRLTRNPLEAHDPLLRDVFAHSVAPQAPRKIVTLGEFLDRFLKFTKENRSETTFEVAPEIRARG